MGSVRNVGTDQLAAVGARQRWFAVPASWPHGIDLPRAAYRALLIVLILIGVYFRSRRYWLDPLGLWLDEATWALRLFRRPLTQLEFRPIGYMALTKLIVTVYSDERTLRLLSYVAGVASLLVTADLAKYLFKSRLVRVLCVAVVAYNPLLIDMAREFKPYSVEFCVHLGLVWLFVRWRASRSLAWLAALLSGSALAFPFAYNIVFLLPESFALLGYTFLRAKAYRALLATVCAAMGAAAVMVVIYVSALGDTTKDGDRTEHFWGTKYDVFYLPKAHQLNTATARIRWLARKYCDLAALPGSHGEPPSKATPAVMDTIDKLAEVGFYAWLSLHGLGLFTLLVYRRQWALLLIGPLLVSIAFNALSLWPFGAFRTNVFLLAYLILIPMVGLDVLLAARVAVVRLGGAVGSALLLVTNLSAGFESHVRKHFFSGQTEMASLVRHMASIRAQQPDQLRREPTLTLLDSYSCAPFIFETRYNDSARREFGSFLTNEIDIRCPETISAASNLLRRAPGQLIFVVVTDDRRMSAYARMLRTQFSVVDHEKIRDTHDLYLVKVR